MEIYLFVEIVFIINHLSMGLFLPSVEHANSLETKMLLQVILNTNMQEYVDAMNLYVEITELFSKKNQIYSGKWVPIMLAKTNY
jgi:hypothetical protein